MSRPEPMPSTEFDQFATSYDDDLKRALPKAMEEESEYFAQYKIDHVMSKVGARPPARLLDFGCGPGRSLQRLADALPGCDVVGYDPSSDSLDVARSRCPRAELFDDWDEVKAKRFDLVFAANVFHHIPRGEVALWLTRCGEVLAEGGRLMIFEHNPLNPATRHVFERCVFDTDADMLSRRALIETAHSVGLRAASKDYTLFFPKSLRALRRLEPKLGWLPLGAQYCLELVRGA